MADSERDALARAAVRMREASVSEGTLTLCLAIVRSEMEAAQPSAEPGLGRVMALVERGPHWSPHPDVLGRVPADREWGKALIAVADVRAALTPKDAVK